MRVLVLFGLLFLAPLSWSIDAESLADPTLQKRYQRITFELRCLVCQNQSIQDSDAQLAKDLRRQVREMLLAGRSDLEIMDYMVERYGDYVRYRPALSRSNLGLYLAPALVALLGLVMLGMTLRRHLARDEQSAENEFDSSGPTENEFGEHPPTRNGHRIHDPIQEEQSVQRSSTIDRTGESLDLPPTTDANDE